MLYIRSILVPIDFSAPSRQALDTARALAQQFGAALHVLHVLEEPSYPGFYGAGAVTLYGEVPDLKKRAEEAMADWLADSPIDVTAAVVKGKAKHDILDYAHEHAVDLIVIASKGLSGVERVLLGSVAQHIVREAPCPVFVVRGEDAVEEPSAPDTDA